ncbi:MAG: hypothetical protein ACI8X5_000048 [Planctomycetota bacterium]|jgi:hypothetical protein
MSKNREKKHAEHQAEQQAHVQDAIEHAADHHQDHLVEAPKGTSRGRFLFQLFLVVFLLLIFSITGPMMSTLSGDNAQSGVVFFGWVTPEGETIELDQRSFMEQKQMYARIGEMLPGLMFGLGQVDPQDDFQLARFLILEKLAARSGIFVADSEVADAIVSAFGSAAGYNVWISSQYNLSPASFEGMLRRALVVSRFLLLSSLTGSEVLTADVIENWKLTAEEFSFEYVEALTEDLTEEVTAAIIPDAELEEWFNAQTEFQKNPYKTERSLAADIAWFDPTSDSSYAGLFETYPRPEEEVAEDMAKTYFQAYSHIRFLKPAPEDDGEEESDVAEAEEAEAEEAEVEDKFYTFEEVEDQVRREAPIYYSMVDWFSHIQKRIVDGEIVDLQTEATLLGFNYERVTPRTRTAWLEGEEPWAGRYQFSAMGSPVEGNYGRRVAIEEDALVITKVIEIVPPALPAFAEIRDKVAEKWIEERCPVVAAEKLEAIRDAFGERPEEGMFDTTASSEEFKAAVEAAGHEVQERGYARQFPRSTDDDDRPTQAEFYIRSKSILFGLDEGNVITAEATRDGNAAYLVRVGGKRDGDPSTMIPSEADSSIQQLRRTAIQAFFSSSYGDFDWMRNEFNVKLASLDDQDDA